uniref:BTB domain-containing protein n=1 Tax=Strigamia maritima TaxID=126957 RepID=T1J5L0_STRMM
MDGNLSNEMYELPEQRVKVFHTLDSMRRHQLLCDVTLVCEGREFPVHKAILSASSQYFYSMFLGELVESKADRVELHEIDPRALEQIIEFMYTCEVTIVRDNVEPLLAASNLLQLDLVRDRCCQVLASLLSPTTCLQIWHIADLYACESLCARVEAYSQQYFVEVIKTSEFLTLEKEKVIKLICSDNLTVPSEEKVFEAVITWVKHEMEQRESYLAELMSYVRLPLLSVDFLVTQVKEEPLINCNLDCSKLVMEAMTYHMMKEGQPKNSPLAEVKPRTPAGIEQVMIVFGGEDETAIQTMECYSFREKIWCPSQEMPIFLSKAGCAVLDNVVYLIGGFNGSRHLRTVITYDPSREKYAYISSMHYVRSEVGVGVLAGRIYAVGGSDGTSCLRTVEYYDVRNDRWKMVAPMLSGKAAAGVGCVNGLLYAVGGYDRESLVSTMECYNPQMDTWTVVPGVKCPRKYVGAAELNGLLYLAGGRYSDDSASLKVHCFDPQSNKLRQVKDMPCTFPSPIVLTKGGMLYVDGRIKYLCYSPENDMWTELKGKAIYRHHSMAAIVLASLLSPTTCLQIWLIADSYACESLCARVEAYTQQYFVEVMKTDNLTVSSEEKVFEAAITWVKHEMEHRESYLAELIRFSRYSGQRGATNQLQPRLLETPVGGSDGTSCLRTVEYYDVRNDRWKMVAPMLSGKAAAGVGCVNGLLDAVGGYDRESLVSTMGCYNPQMDSWTVVPGVKCRFEGAPLTYNIHESE